MDTSRRFFLGALAASTALSSLRSAQAQNASTPANHTRRDVSTISLDDPIITAYRDAVAEMQRRPANDPLSWEHQATIHLNYCPHQNWYFLPWHRAYLAQFEDIIRHISGNPEWALPYWDWTRNPQIPAAFWVNGSVLNHPRRARTDTNMPSEFVGLPVIERIMRKQTFEDFASYKSSAPALGTGGGSAELEGSPHNNVHVTIGGDMVTFMSPLDPIFWLHHCNIDRIWASWNAAGNPNSSDPDLADFVFSADQPDNSGNLNGSQFVNPDSSPRSFRVVNLYTTQELVYDYDRLEAVPMTSFEMASRNLVARGMTSETLSAELSRSASAGVAIDTTLSLPAEVDVAVSETARIRSLAVSPNQEFVMPQSLTTATLKVRGLRAIAGPETTFRVFVNCDYLTLETPINDPHYVGSAAFFLSGVEGEGHQHGTGADFVFDLTAAIDALRRSDRPINGQIRPQILGFTANGEGTELAIDGRFEITIDTVG